MRPLDQAELFVHHLGQRRQAVGRTRGVRHHCVIAQDQRSETDAGVLLLQRLHAAQYRNVCTSVREMSTTTRHRDATLGVVESLQSAEYEHLSTAGAAAAMMLPVPLDFRAVLQECIRNVVRHAILSQIFQPRHTLLYLRTERYLKVVVTVVSFSLFATGQHPGMLLVHLRRSHATGFSL